MYFSNNITQSCVVFKKTTAESYKNIICLFEFYFLRYYFMVWYELTWVILKNYGNLIFKRYR